MPKEDAQLFLLLLTVSLAPGTENSSILIGILDNLLNESNSFLGDEKNSLCVLALKDLCNLSSISFLAH